MTLLRNYTNKNAPAMAGAFKQPSQRSYVAMIVEGNPERTHAPIIQHHCPRLKVNDQGPLTV
jgi:hypothetical protein